MIAQLQAVAQDLLANLGLSGTTVATRRRTYRPRPRRTNQKQRREDAAESKSRNLIRLPPMVTRGYDLHRGSKAPQTARKINLRAGSTHIVEGEAEGHPLDFCLFLISARCRYSARVRAAMRMGPPRPVFTQHIWTYLDISGHIWTHLALSAHLDACYARKPSGHTA